MAGKKIDPEELIRFVDAVAELKHPMGYDRLYKLTVNEGTRVKIDKRYYIRRADLERYKKEING